MNLQLVGVLFLAVGVIALSEPDLDTTEVSQSGKFDFRYQWHKSKVSAKALNNLRKEAQKHLSFLT
jgi:hypothetical protein